MMRPVRARYRRRRQVSGGSPCPAGDTRAGAYDDVVGGAAADLRRCYADSALHRRVESLEVRKFRFEWPFAVKRLSRIGDHFRRMALSGADEEVIDAVVVEISDGNARRSL